MVIKFKRGLFFTDGILAMCPVADDRAIEIHLKGSTRGSFLINTNKSATLIISAIFSAYEDGGKSFDGSKYEVVTEKSCDV